jgi:hypothetical protein
MWRDLLRTASWIAVAVVLAGCVLPGGDQQVLTVNLTTDAGDYPVLNATATRTQAPLLAKALDEARTGRVGYVRGEENIEATFDFLDGQLGNHSRIRRVSFESERFEIGAYA